MNKVSFVAALISSTMTLSAFAAQGVGSGTSNCPVDAQIRMDMPADPANLQFGPGTSEVTECLKNRTHVQVVVNVSSKDINGKGIQQQINNVNNMWDSYESLYGMKIDRDYVIKVVVHGLAGKYLLNDSVFVAKYPTEAKVITESDGSVHLGSPTGKLVRDLIAKGITVYMCQNTMKNNGWATADLIPGLTQTPAGVTAVVDFAAQGFTLITP